MAVKKKKKTKSLAKVVEEAAVLLQKLRRLESSCENGYCECVTCGKSLKWNDGAFGGHWLDRGNSSTKIEEWNIHVQCLTCNGPFSNKGIIIGRYTIYMEEMYGKEFVCNMLDTKGTIKKHDRLEVLEKITEFKVRIKIEERRLGC